MRRSLPLLSFLSLFLIPALTNGQGTVYEKNFESYPVPGLYNFDGNLLPDGGSPCSKASRGDTSDFNSSNVDFKGGQNNTHFMGVNPESPCGGFYTADVDSDTLDLSTYDSLVFKSKYFVSNSLGWGGTTVQVQFDNGSSTFSIDSVFSTVGDWDSVTVSLPSSMISDSVWMTFTIGGGEGVAMDDIRILNFSGSTGIAQKADPEITLDVHPNPTQGRLQVEGVGDHRGGVIEVFGMDGRVLLERNVTGKREILDLEGIASGVYILKVRHPTKKPLSKKILLE